MRSFSAFLFLCLFGLTFSQTQHVDLNQYERQSIELVAQLSSASSCNAKALSDLRSQCSSLAEHDRKVLEINLLDCYMQEARGTALPACSDSDSAPKVLGQGRCIAGRRVAESDVPSLLLVKTKVVDMCLFYGLIESGTRSERLLEALRSASLNATLTLIRVHGSLDRVAQLQLEAADKAQLQLAILEEAGRRAQELESGQEKLRLMQAELSSAVEIWAGYARKTHGAALAVLGGRFSLSDIALYLTAVPVTLLGPWSPRARVGLLALVGLAAVLDRGAPKWFHPWLEASGAPGTAEAMTPTVRLTLALPHPPVMPSFEGLPALLPATVLHLLPPSLQGSRSGRPQNDGPAAKPRAPLLSVLVPLRALTRTLVAAVAVALFYFTRGKRSAKAQQGQGPWQQYSALEFPPLPPPAAPLPSGPGWEEAWGPLSMGGGPAPSSQAQPRHNLHWQAYNNPKPEAFYAAYGPGPVYGRYGPGSAPPDGVPPHAYRPPPQVETSLQPWSEDQGEPSLAPMPTARVQGGGRGRGAGRGAAVPPTAAAAAGQPELRPWDSEPFTAHTPGTAGPTAATTAIVLAPESLARPKAKPRLARTPDSLGASLAPKGGVSKRTKSQQHTHTPHSKGDGDQLTADKSAAPTPSSAKPRGAASGGRAKAAGVGARSPGGSELAHGIDIDEGPSTASVSRAEARESRKRRAAEAGLPIDREEEGGGGAAGKRRR